MLYLVHERSGSLRHRATYRDIDHRIDAGPTLTHTDVIKSTHEDMKVVTHQRPTAFKEEPGSQRAHARARSDSRRIHAKERGEERVVRQGREWLSCKAWT